MGDGAGGLRSDASLRLAAAASVALLAALAAGAYGLGRLGAWSAMALAATPPVAWGLAEIFVALARWGDTQAAPLDFARLWLHDAWIALGVYLACTLLFFWPVLGDLDGAVIGRALDQPAYLWSLWWGHEVLLGRPDASLLFTDLLFFPDGTSLVYNVYSWYNLLLAIPLRSMLSLPATYNLLQLHTFVLSGLGAFALARHLTRDSMASLVAGFVFAFSPLHVATSLVHINIASVQFLPFFILFFLRSLRAPGLANRALAALFFLLNAACSWYHLIYALLFIAGAYVYLAFQRRRILLPGFLATAAISMAGLLPLLPWIAAMLAAGPRDVATTWAIPGYDHYVADLVALVVPHDEHLLGGLGPIAAVNARYPLNDLYPHTSTAYLGLCATALAGVALARVRALAAPLAAAALAFLLFAMGSHLHVAGWVLPVALPTRLFQELPFLDSLRTPIRAMLPVYLFLGILSGLGLAILRQRVGAGWKRRAWVGAALGLLLLDYGSVAREVTRVDPPEAYAAIPRDGSRFGILDVPLTPTNAALYMAYQTEHGLPMAAGYDTGAGGEKLLDRIAGKTPRRIRELLLDADVRYVVVHHHPPDGPERASGWIAMLRSLGLEPLYTGAEATVFALDPGAR